MPPSASLRSRRTGHRLPSTAVSRFEEPRAPSRRLRPGATLPRGRGATAPPRGLELEQACSRKAPCSSRGQSRSFVETAPTRPSACVRAGHSALPRSARDNRACAAESSSPSSRDLQQSRRSRRSACLRRASAPRSALAWPPRGEPLQCLVDGEACRSKRQGRPRGRPPSVTRRRRRGAAELGTCLPRVLDQDPPHLDRGRCDELGLARPGSDAPASRR